MKHELALIFICTYIRKLLEDKHRTSEQRAA